MSEKILSLAMRPRRLSDMVGQRSLAKAIRQQMTTRPPSAFLLTGGTGCGKTTLARILALSFQCSHQTEWGSPCDSCWSKWSDFDIHEINASEIKGVEEIGKVAEMARFQPMPPSLKRVIILDEAQMMSSNAQNLLLKPFEDVAKNTVWITCTTAPAKILATLRRRCVTYVLRSLSFKDREALITSAAKTVSLKRDVADLIEAAHEAQVSSPALLLMALEKYASGLSPAEALAGSDAQDANSLRICKAMGASNWVELRTCMASASPEDSRWIRASALGYLKGMLVRETSPKRQGNIADCMLWLTAIAPLEDALLLQWLWATLNKVCRRLKEA